MCKGESHLGRFAVYLVSARKTKSRHLNTNAKLSLGVDMKTGDWSPLSEGSSEVTEVQHDLPYPADWSPAAAASND
ncbi:hypothetical protein N7494_000070 [Penicillium frequentans]|uniref:Uncharacterized protein n=1 Tax=Penicillium frequentans TaxID=3151616 RepID=A0AAD6D730_9EURO|nr:hypothetical protein N7494_000070 [Penicillium glabrum]